MTGLAGLLLTLTAALPVRAQLTVVWGGGNGSWNNAANWASESVPAGTDTAQVTTGSASVDTDVTVARLLLEGGNIAGSANLTLSGSDSAWTAGTFTGSGTLTVGRGGSLTIATGNDHDFNGHAIVNSGTITWTAGYLRTGQGGSITNTSGATFKADADGYTMHVPGGYGGSGVFNNLGTLTHTTSGVVVFDVPVNNTGLISATNGTLYLNAGGTSSGTISATGKGNLVISTSYTLTDGAALSGPIKVTAGSLSATGNISVDGLSFEGGNLSGSQTWLGGTFDWLAGNWNTSAPALTTIAAGTTLNIATGSDHDFNARSITNLGTVNWSAGYLRAGQGSVFTNAEGATFNDLNASNYTLHTPGGYGGSFTFVNAGTYRRTVGGTTAFDIPITNSGTIDLQQGEIVFRNGGSFTSTGTIYAAAATSVVFNSDFTLFSGSALSGPGAYTLSTGTLTIPDGTLSISTFTQNGGVLAGSPTIAGVYTWNGGLWNTSAPALTTIAPGATLNIATGSDHDLNARSITNNGTINWTSGYIRGGQGSVFTNSEGATFNDLNASGYTFHVPGGYGGAFTFVNEGTYRRTVSGTTAFDIPFTNSGTIDLQQGEIIFRNGGSFTSTGTIYAAAETSVVFNSNFTLFSGSALSGPGAYTLNAGTLTIPEGTLSISTFTQNNGVLAGSPIIAGVFNWNSGLWNTSSPALTTVASGATLNIATGSDHDLSARSITNNGTVNWTSGYIRGGQGSVFTNSVGAVFNDRNASGYTFHVPGGYGGNFTFENQGIYSRDAAGTTFFDIPFNNSGTVDLAQGSLEFRAGGTLDAVGTMTAARGTNIYFRTDYTVRSGSSLLGAGDYWLTGGTLTVNGTLKTSRFTQTGGTLGGATNGISGLYNWYGGTWNSSPGATTTLNADATLNLDTGSDHDFNGRSITNLGNVTWTSGYIRAGQGSVFTNAAGARFTDLNSSGYSFHTPGGYGGTFTFVNNGTYRRDAAGTTYFDIPFNNNAVVDLAQGSLEFRAGGVMSATGTIAAAAGTNVFFRGDYSIVNGAALTGVGTYSLSGGTLTLSGAIAVGNFNQIGGTLAGNNSITGNFTWSDGTWNGSAGDSTTIAAGATLNIASGSNHDFNARTITNFGNVTWTSGYLRAGQGSVFTNAAGGTFTDRNTDGYSIYSPGGYGGAFTFVNNGTYLRSASGTSYLDLPFTNSGLLKLTAGDLQLRAGGTLTSTSSVVAEPGTHLYFLSNYTILDGAQFSGTGLVNQIGANLSINGALRASSFLWSGGNWNAAANSGLTTTIAPGTVLNLTNANDGARDFYGRTILNQGVTNWSSAYLRSGGGGSFTNAVGGIFHDLNTDGYSIYTPGDFGGAFSFTNNGTYQRNATGTTYLDAPFNNNGTLSLLVGDLQLRAGGVMSGTSVVTAAAGTHLYFTNSYAIETGATFSGAGLVAQTGGTLTINGTLTAQSFLWSGGNWNAAASSGLVTTIAPSTVLNLTNTNDTTRDFYGRTILNQGVTNWTNSYLRSGGGGSFTNAVGGVFNDLNTDGYSIYTPGDFGGAFSFTNNGTYRRNASGTTFVDVPFNNNGTVSLLTGDLQLRGGGLMSVTSVVSAAAGTHLYFTNNYTLANGAQFQGPGLVAQIGGTLTLDGTLAAQSFQWSGGNWNTAANSGQTAIIGVGTTLNLTNSNDSTRDFYGRTILNRGIVNWYGGYLRSGGGGNFTNAAGATFHDLNADGYSVYTPGDFGGAFSFNNAGTYLKSTGGTTQIAVPFTNTGRILIEAGTLSFTSTFTNSGGSLSSTGGNFAFSSAVDLGTGTLSGVGTITAPSVTAGGLVSPGNSPGQLALTGDLTLLSTSTLLLELGGTTRGVGYDFLSIGGTATLNGTLVVNFTGGFQATVTGSDTFTVVTAGNLTGTFANVGNGQRLFTNDGLGSFVVNYGPGSAFASDSLVLNSFVPVPEPSTYALLSLGVLVLVAAQRRRK